MFLNKRIINAQGYKKLIYETYTLSINYFMIKNVSPRTSTIDFKRYVTQFTVITEDPDITIQEREVMILDGIFHQTSDILKTVNINFGQIVCSKENRILQYFLYS